MPRFLLLALTVLALLAAPVVSGSARAAETAKPAVEAAKDAAKDAAVKPAVEAAKPAVAAAAVEAPKDAAKPAEAPAAAAPAAAPAAAAPAVAPTVQVDKPALQNGGTVKVSGTAAPGKPVYIEVWAEDLVRSNVFDSDPDKDGKRPYKLYLTEGLPAYYHILVPKDKKDIVQKYKDIQNFSTLTPEQQEKLKDIPENRRNNKWAYSQALKDLGADIAFNVPAKMPIDAYQASIMASIIGSRGELLPKLDDKENRARGMQLTKSRFRGVGRLLSAAVDVKPDGAYSAEVKVPEGSAPGKYNIAVTTGKGETAKATFENSISFPMMYMENAGASINVIWPFLLTLGIAIFGVLMGAGGGFILNPLLLALFPLPHTIVAGTVTPTVLFSQGMGIASYSKIKFINWKLGISIGLAMAAGGFIGPKLTEMISLDQFKFLFGWVLLILAALMFWQTTPGYLEKNKKEQAILKEFKKRAEEAAKNA